MSAEREHYIDRAERSALLTQPLLFPKDGFNYTTNLSDPYQSVGSRGTENLTSKLLTTLFPTGVQWFQQRLTAEGELSFAEAPQQKSVVELQLQERSKTIWKTLEQPWFRPRIAELLRHLIVGGNGGLWFDHKTAKIRFVPFYSYTVKRDSADNILKIIVHEKIANIMLEEDYGEEEQISRYTCFQRISDDKFYSYQEINEKMVEGSDAEYPLELLPFLPLRWEHHTGESYGRSFVDKVIGDLATVEGLSEALIDVAALAARVVFAVNPGGVTDITDLEMADNGDFISGVATDVAAVQVGKLQDIGTASQLLEEVRRQLREAFFMGSTVQRSGERVTATEIQYLAQELDTALGGAFSLLAEEIQGPIVRLTENYLQKKNVLVAPPKGILEVQLITGIEGLGRSSEMQSLSLFNNMVQQTIPQQEFTLMLDYYEQMLRIAKVAGIQIEGLVMPREEYEQAKLAQQQAYMAQQSLPLIQDEVRRQSQAAAAEEGE